MASMSGFPVAGSTWRLRFSQSCWTRSAGRLALKDIRVASAVARHGRHVGQRVLPIDIVHDRSVDAAVFLLFDDPGALEDAFCSLCQREQANTQQSVFQ